MLEITYIMNGKEKKLKGIFAQLFLDSCGYLYGEMTEYRIPRKIEFLHIKNACITKERISFCMNQNTSFILDHCKMDTTELSLKGGDIELHHIDFLKPSHVFGYRCQNFNLELKPCDYEVSYNLEANESIYLKGNAQNQNVCVRTDKITLNHIQNMELCGRSYTWNILNSDIFLPEEIFGVYFNVSNSKIKGDCLDFRRINQLDFKKVVLEATDKVMFPNYTYVRKEQDHNVIVTDSLLDLQSDVQYHNTIRNLNKGTGTLVRNYESKTEGLSCLISILKGLKEKVEKEELERIEKKATEKVLNKFEALMKELEKTETEYQKVLGKSREAAKNTALKKILK